MPWSVSYPFIRGVGPQLGPALLMEDLRVLVSGTALAPNTALPFILVAFAQTHVTTSLATILVATNRPRWPTCSTSEEGALLGLRFRDGRRPASLEGG